MSPLGPDGHSQTDLPGTFRHGNIHDIHDPDTPNQ